MILARLSHNAGDLKVFFDVLKDIITDVNFVFKPSGLWINTTDPEKVVGIHLHISTAFEYTFPGSDSVFIGVNIQHFYKLIRSANASHILTLEVENDTMNVLKVKIENLTKEIISTTSLYSLDLPKNEIVFPEIRYQAVGVMPTADFVRTVKDLSHGSKKLTISAREHELATKFPTYITFSTKGDTYAYTTSISICSSEQGFRWHYFDMKSFSGQYLSKYIEKFAKPQISKLIDISVDAHNTLTLSYPFMSLATFSMTIAPITVSED